MKRAHTLIEVLIAVMLIGFLLMITIINIPNIAPDVDKAKFKKAYANFEKAIATSLNDEVIYPDESGFKYTQQIILKDIGETLGLEGPETKFRDVIKHRLNIVKDNIQECNTYNDMPSSSGCFMTDDGVVWAIPDTDFELTGVTTSKIGNVAPIVLYTKWQPGQSVDDYGFIVGVRFDGNIRILYTVECNDESLEMQCRSIKYLKSNTIKSEDT